MNFSVSGGHIGPRPPEPRRPRTAPRSRENLPGDPAEVSHRSGMKRSGTQGSPASSQSLHGLSPSLAEMFGLTNVDDTSVLGRQHEHGWDTGKWRGVLHMSEWDRDPLVAVKRGFSLRGKGEDLSLTGSTFRSRRAVADDKSNGAGTGSARRPVNSGAKGSASSQGVTALPTGRPQSARPPRVSLHAYINGGTTGKGGKGKGGRGGKTGKGRGKGKGKGKGGKGKGKSKPPDPQGTPQPSEPGNDDTQNDTAITTATTQQSSDQDNADPLAALLGAEELRRLEIAKQREREARERERAERRAERHAEARKAAAHRAALDRIARGAKGVRSRFFPKLARTHLDGSLVPPRPVPEFPAELHLAGYATARRRLLRCVFDAMDTDADGTVSAREFRLAAWSSQVLFREVAHRRTAGMTDSEVFALIDADSDGRVSFDELCSFFVGVEGNDGDIGGGGGGDEVDDDRGKNGGTAKKGDVYNGKNMGGNNGQGGGTAGGAVMTPRGGFMKTPPPPTTVREFLCGPAGPGLGIGIVHAARGWSPTPPATGTPRQRPKSAFVRRTLDRTPALSGPPPQETWLRCNSERMAGNQYDLDVD